MKNGVGGAELNTVNRAAKASRKGWDAISLTERRSRYSGSCDMR